MNFLLFKSRALDGEFGKILTDLFVRDSIFLSLVCILLFGGLCQRFRYDVGG